jgi:hypothetical protein
MNKLKKLRNKINNQINNRVNVAGRAVTNAGAGLRQGVKASYDTALVRPMMTTKSKIRF